MASLEVLDAKVEEQRTPIQCARVSTEQIANAAAVKCQRQDKLAFMIAAAEILDLDSEVSKVLQAFSRSGLPAPASSSGDASPGIRESGPCAFTGSRGRGPCPAESLQDLWDE